MVALLRMAASIAFLWLFRQPVKRLIIGAAVSYAALFLYGIYLCFGTSCMQKFTIQAGIGWGTDNVIGGLFRVAYGFLAGMALYVGWERLKETRLARIFLHLRWQQVFVYVALLSLFAFPFWLRGLYYFAAIGVAAPVLVYIGSLSEPTSDLGRKVSVWLGAISYPVYCLHTPMRHAAQLVFSAQGEVFQNIIAFVATLLFSAILLKLYDEPLRKWLTRHCAARSSVTAGSLARSG